MSTGATWELGRTSSGWCLWLRSWPADDELERLIEHLRGRGDFLHRVDVLLPTHAPTRTHVTELIELILSELPSAQLGVWYAGNLTRRVNGYEKWRDPLSGSSRRPYVATNDPIYKGVY